MTCREFLSIPRFRGKLAVRKMGRFNVLVCGGSDENVIVMALNPDSDLRSLYDGMPIAYGCSENELAKIIKDYHVQDPFVLERLDPTWNPFAPPTP